MKIRTKIDEHKNLIYTIRRLIHYEPFGQKFEDLYKKLMQILISNIPGNKDDLVLLYSKDIDKNNEITSQLLKKATEKERAFFNMGRVSGLCDLIGSLGEYEQSIRKFLKPYIDLDIDDVVYIKNNNILYKTLVTKKDKDKIQVKYGNRWFTQDDYLEVVFPYEEEENLCKAGILNYYSDCNKCKGFKQGKCVYGYSVSTYNGFSYRFDNTKYKVLKGKPNELCCKNIKD